MKSFVWRNSQLREKLQSLSISWFYSRKKSRAFDLNFVFMKKNCNWHNAYIYKSRKNYLIVAQNDLFKWIETQFLSAVNVNKIFDFLWKNVICRHDCFEKLIINDEFKNHGWIVNLFKKYDNKRVVISAYHFQTNDMMKKKHKFLINALSKISADNRENWIKYLLIVLWTDRSTVKINIKKTSYFFCVNASPYCSLKWNILFEKFCFEKKFETSVIC